MAKKNNWFDPVPAVKPVTARLVQFDNLVTRLIPGATTALDTVYIERQKALSFKRADKKVVLDDKSDFVLRLVRE